MRGLQLGIGHGARRGLTMAPRIVPAGGDAQDAAQGGDGILLLVSAQESETSTTSNRPPERTKWRP